MLSCMLPGYSLCITFIYNDYILLPPKAILEQVMIVSHPSLSFTQFSRGFLPPSIYWKNEHLSQETVQKLKFTISCTRTTTTNIS